MRLQLSNACVPIAIAFLLTACSVNVRKDAEGKEKNVDINTPFGGIHVNKNADVRDTGLPVYPGARPKKRDEEGDEKSANVDISKYGKVLECHTSHGARYGGGHHDPNRDSDELKCEGDDHGKTVELKVGTESNQHIVSIEPQAKGSKFALVFVRTRGKEGTI